MVIFRPIGHLAAWLVWHSTGVSLYEDLDAPRPPAPVAASQVFTLSALLY